MITTNDKVRTRVAAHGFPAGSVGKVAYSETEDNEVTFYVKFPESPNARFGYSAADLSDATLPEVTLPADCKSLPTMAKLDILADVARRLGIELVAGRDHGIGATITVYDGPTAFQMCAHPGGFVDIFPTSRKFTLEG